MKGKDPVLLVPDMEKPEWLVQISCFFCWFLVIKHKCTSVCPIDPIVSSGLLSTTLSTTLFYTLKALFAIYRALYSIYNAKINKYTIGIRGGNSEAVQQSVVP